MIGYSPIVKFAEVFLQKVDPLVIPNVKEDLQWLSVLNLYKERSSKDLEKFCSEVIEVVLVSTEDWSPSTIEEADTILRDSGCITLSDIKRRSQKQLIRIVKQARIRNSKEYDLAKSAVDDSVGSMSPAMKSELERLLISFEEGR